MALMFLLKLITIVNANDTHLENIIAIDNLLLPLTVMPKTAELLMPLRVHFFQQRTKYLQISHILVHNHKLLNFGPLHTKTTKEKSTG